MFGRNKEEVPKSVLDMKLEKEKREKEEKRKSRKKEKKTGFSKRFRFLHIELSKEEKIR